MGKKDLNNFEHLFRELFEPLCRFSMKYVKDWDEAKGVVHEIFVTLWEKMDVLPHDTNFRSYLYTAVRNRSLNYLRDKKKHVILESIPPHQLVSLNSELETSELEREIELGIQSLPEKCRQVFELNRGEGLKYAQIAEKLGISVKTVEAQITKALSMLRTHLGEFIPLLIFMLCS